jgi:Fe-S cluster assembly protein SufD
MAEAVGQWLNQVTPLPWLQEKSSEGAGVVNSQPWPTPKAEYWKYTSLKHIERGGFDFSAIEQASPVSSEAVSIIELDTFNLVFVDGQFRADLSNLDPASPELPEGLDIIDFAHADAGQQAFIRDALHSTVQEQKHVLAHLSVAMLSQGLLIRVAPETRIEKPVQITHYTTAQADQKGMQHRVLVHLGHHAELNLVEMYGSDDSAHTGWMNQVTEVIQEPESAMQHYRLHQEQQAMAHTGAVHVTLDKQARFNSFLLGYGGKLKRLDYVVHHEGPAAECNLQGVYLVNQRQHFDLRTQIEHKVPHCLTDEVFRGIIDDKGLAVFNGKIHIHKHAQKTLAEMSNRNLLLSENAQINTKPELEIYADDVKCAHGATISQMDSDALVYLRSRGISAAEAAVMLSFGFINEILMTIKHPEILGYIRPSIVRRFGQDERLMRHLL